MPPFGHVTMAPPYLMWGVRISLWMEQVCRIVCAEADSSKQDRDKWMPLSFFFSNWELEYSKWCSGRSDQMKYPSKRFSGKLFL